MSVPVWPASLPQALRRAGYGEAPPDLSISSKTDTGPGKSRRRSSAGVRPITGQIKGTQAQMLELMSFYTETLLSGSIRFAWLDTLDPSRTVEYKFAEAPQVSIADDGQYIASLSLEILP